MKKYQLWHSESSTTYSFFPEDNMSASNMLESDAKCVWEIQAETWEEALAKRDEFLEWSPSSSGNAETE